MKNNLYNILLFCLIAFFAYSPANASNSDITILSSGDDGLRFRLAVNQGQLQKQTTSDSGVVFFKSVSVGIPGGSQVVVLSANGFGAAALTKQLIPKSTTVAQAPPLVRVSPPITVRGRQCVNVVISPVVNGMVFGEVEVGLGFVGGTTAASPTASADRYFDRVLKAALINYEQFQTWPAMVERSRSKAASVAAHPFSTVSTWYKIGVNVTGLTSVTGAQLRTAGLNLTNVASGNIHVFNGGGLPLPLDNSLSRPEFTEIAVMVDDGGDGRFDADDQVVFYSEAEDRRLFIPADTFVNNAYADRNVYWLAASPDLGGAGLRMQLVDESNGGAADTTIDTFRRRVHAEQDNMLRKYKAGEIYDYYHWYWSDTARISVFVSTFGAKEDETAQITLFGKTSGSGGQAGYMDLTVNGIAAFSKNCSSTRCAFETNNLRDGLNEMNMLLYEFATVAPYFDYIDVEYVSYMAPKDDILDITIGDTDANATLRVTDEFSASPTVLNISDPQHPTIVANAVSSGGFLTFRADLLPGQMNRYYAAPVSAAIAPVSIDEVSVTDLRASSGQADLIVIAPRQFEPALEEYVSYRRGEGYAVQTVTAEDIVDNFASGLYDPIAIRDFLKYAYENYPAPTPTYVLLVGDGTYDFADVLGTPVVNHIPPFIHPFFNEQFYSDDFYVYFGRYGILDSDTSYDTTVVSFDRGYDMLISRWPVRSTDEIAIITEKIKRYEQPDNFGTWRTDITLVADDEFTTGTYNESIHTIQAEELDSSYIPSVFHRNKIYLWEYPFVSRYKPAVNDAIVNAFNRGTLLVNYVGHGNPDLWAHEHVFTRTDDIPRLDNLDRLPLVFTASCEIAFFDNPQREGMAEDLLRASNGGAVGVISATRRVYSSPNAEFNQQVFDVLLDKQTDDLTICEAMYTAKLIRQYNTFPPSPIANDQAYLYFGDPLLSLGIPQLDIAFDQVPDSLLALTATTVSGTVVDENQTPVIRDGRLLVTVYDSDRHKTHFVVDPNGGVPLDTVSYNVTGPTIFRGSASITGGNFEFSFVPPLDIGYGGQGAKIAAYAILDDIDGMGMIDSVAVSETVTASNDTLGPVISYSFTARADFVSGDYINADDELELTISDNSGVNLTGGLGHGITLEIDGESGKAVDLTDQFEYNENDYTTGRLTHVLEDIPVGRHSFKIKAWDNANNSSSEQFNAEVLAGEMLAIKDLLNYPNPMKDSTRFSFYLTQPTGQISLEIYTLSGKKIKSMVHYGLRQPGYYDDITWYGEDSDRDRVATGVYIYKASAVPSTGQKAVESFGKLVVIN